MAISAYKSAKHANADTIGICKCNCAKRFLIINRKTDSHEPIEPFFDRNAIDA